MIHIIIFSIIALSIFIATFLKLIKENNANYLFALIPEFIGICIDFICIFLVIEPNWFVITLMYLLSIVIPIISVILRNNNINLIELISLTKANYYENNNRKEEAKQILLNNVQKYKNSYLSNKSLAEWYEKNNELEKSEYLYQKIIELKPKNLNNYLKLAHIYKETDKKDNAVKILENLLKNKPENLEASLLLGDILYSNEMFKEAINIYKQALNYNPGEYELYYSLGMTYTRLNDFQNAMEYYKKAATINSVVNAGNLNMGQISLIFNEYDEAEKYFIQCSESEDEKLQSQAYYYLAKIKLINGQRDLAIQYANLALEINPSIIKIMEKDEYFTVIIGKVQTKQNKRVQSKINIKEEELINHLNKTYRVVEKLTTNQKENNFIDKEQEI